MSSALRASTQNPLGASSVEVTALGFGGAALGNLYEPVSDDAAAATLGAALAGGVGYVDTAPYYGYGLSEERIGLVLEDERAGRPVLSTKVGRLLVPRKGGAREDQGFIGARPRDPVFDYTYDGVMRSWEESCERLAGFRPDILLLHDLGAATHGADRHSELFGTAMAGGYRALAALRSGGEIGAIGLGVNECAVCMEAMDYGDFDCILLAGRYTLLEQGALDEMLPKCAAQGVSVIVGGPFNSGALVESTDQDFHYDYASAKPEIVERVRALGRVCAAHDISLPAAALQFPLHHERVASVIPGARNAAEVHEQLAWFEAPIPASLWSDLIGEGLLDERSPMPPSDRVAE